MTARLVIAAPRSGEGKTSVVLGMASALARRGVSVSVCKVGPDYLDTGWHSVAAGRPARNLDLWTMGEQGVRAAFARAAEGADIVLIEGVMGLYDGHRHRTAECSTADVARLLEAPVLLALDASRAGATIAAVAHGLATFDPRITVAGAVLNRFGEHRERAAVADAFDRARIPVLGWVPTSPDVSLPSRHLGLVQAEEDAAAACEAVSLLGDLVEKSCDLDAVIAAARSASTVAPALPTWAGMTEPGVTPRIAVARDAAFAFYYADNLEALTELGADLVEFSPLRDRELPDEVDGVYLGGGYPETFASALSANETMRASVLRAVERNTPVYAECGGMLYLLESLEIADGAECPMVGALQGGARMDPRLQRLGYAEAELAGDCIIGARGTKVRGHEFRYSHCSEASGVSPAWIVDGEPRGFATDAIVASYLHLNFAGCPAIARDFVAACRRRRTERTR